MQELTKVLLITTKLLNINVNINVFIKVAVFYRLDCKIDQIFLIH